MSEQVTEGPRVGDPIEIRQLWSIHCRPDDSYPWRQVGTDREDAAAVLREYDFSLEKHPELQHQLVTTDVFIWIADPEILREELQRKKSESKPSAVQSE